MQKGRVYSFSVVGGRNLSTELCGELSRVFSSSYGTWSADAPAPLRPGGKIRMSPDKYREWYGTDDFRFALCRAGGILVGHAVYAEFLPAEYLVVDRRFTVDEISKMVEESGLTILLRRFVRAGFSKEFDRGTGKEILIVARKGR